MNDLEFWKEAKKRLKRDFAKCKVKDPKRLCPECLAYEVIEWIDDYIKLLRDE